MKHRIFYWNSVAFNNLTTILRHACGYTLRPGTAFSCKDLFQVAHACFSLGTERVCIARDVKVMLKRGRENCDSQMKKPDPNPHFDKREWATRNILHNQQNNGMGA